MRTYQSEVNGVDCNIEINGGGESDHDTAESRITELSDTGVSIDEISSKVHDEITHGWHDSNGFSVGITPVE